MTHAIVLIQSETSKLGTLGAELAGIEGVAEAYSVTGEWDFVAILRLREQDQLAQVVTGRLSQLDGVRRTQTMVAFEAYSRHDLEALFSDLALVGKHRAVDVALICIGGHYTMDRHDAVDAADFVGAKTIIPCHYNTFPAIETDAGAFQTDIEKTLDAVAVVLEPGAVHQA